MPIYSYKCPNSHQTEAIRKFGDHITKCPECGAPVRQVYHAPTVIYRRRGWKPYSPDDAVGVEKVKEEICESE